MRPPTEAQSALRCPLNSLLGTETNVRILRVLGETDMPIGKAELARRAALNPSGVRRALNGLAELGIVAEVGQAHRRLVTLRKEHTLSEALRALFQTERARFDALVESLRSLTSKLQPPPRSAWIQGPVARGEDEHGDPVVVGILTSARDAAGIRSQFASMLPELVDEPEVQVFAKSWTVADLEALADVEKELEGIMLLAAPHPLELLESRRTTPREPERRVHPDADRLGLALGRAISKKISEDPAWIERAVTHVRERMVVASERERHDLREWLHVLEHKSPAQVRRLLVDPGEHATRLRQSLPFLDVLTDAERHEIMQRSNHDS